MNSINNAKAFGSIPWRVIQSDLDSAKSPVNMA